MDIKVGGSPDMPRFEGVQNTSANTSEQILQNAGNMINKTPNFSTATGPSIPTSKEIPTQLLPFGKVGDVFDRLR